MGVIFGELWNNPPPTEGQVADGKYRYVQGGVVYSPSSGAIYSGGQWLTPAQYQQSQAQQKAQQVYTTAGNKLNELLQNPSSITSTPGYQFAYNQGLEAVNRTAAAKGNLGSGNRLYDHIDQRIQRGRFAAFSGSGAGGDNGARGRRSLWTR